MNDSRVEKFTYLAYLNQPTPENIRFVHDTSGLTQPAAAQLAAVVLDTYKSWLAVGTRSRTPAHGTWNYFLYQLEAKRLGFDNLLDFFQKNSSNN